MESTEQTRSITGPMQSPRSPSSQPYLSVSVTDPVKLGNGVQSYISYRVVTKTNFPEYQGPEKIVIRRYSDFVWLRDRLFEKYKGIFIPPLPEKSAVEKFRFSAEFIEMRRAALDVFVNRIALHSELQQSEDLRTFLQADEEDSIEEVVSDGLEETVVDIHSPPRCRICLDHGELIHLGCECKGELTLAHEECAKKWFTIKNTKICEICKNVAANVEGEFEYKGLSGVCLFSIYFIPIAIFCLVLFLFVQSHLDES